MGMLIAKIVSGGQTGVDRGALEAALELRFPYGGLVPRGRRADDGIVPLVFDQMVEDSSANYRVRTEKNVVNTDATIILNFGRELEGGTLLTQTFCAKHAKPCWVEDLNHVNETDRGLECIYWLETLGEGLVVNFAGAREFRCPGIQAASRAYVMRLIRAMTAG